MMSVFWEIISRYLVIIRIFLRIFQLVLYIFTQKRKITSTFGQFVGGLLTTSNLIFINLNIVLQYIKLWKFKCRLKMLIYIFYEDITWIFVIICCANTKKHIKKNCATIFFSIIILK